MHESVCSKIYSDLRFTKSKYNLLISLFVLAGNTDDIGESVRARSEQIKYTAAGFFSKIIVNFEFLGSTMN